MTRLTLLTSSLLAGSSSLWLAAHAPSPAYAATGPTRSAHTTSFADAGFGTQKLTGQNPVADIYIAGPGPVLFGPHSTLILTYSRSPLVDPKLSSLSVFVNDVNIAGQVLTRVITRPTTLAIRIPPDTLIGNGYNHLQITFGLRDHLAQSCGYTDPALNVTIYGTSKLVYDVRGPKIAPFRPDLAALPAPFVEPGASVTAQITAGLPATPTAAELTGVARVLARLGEDVPTMPPTVTTVLATSLRTLRAQHNLLLVGTPLDNLSISRIGYTAPLSLTGGLWRDPRGRPLPADEGLILETANPWDPRFAALTLTANGQEGIERAATVLGSAALRRLLHGSFALLPRRPEPPPLRQTRRGVVTLAERGYGATLDEGLGEHSSRYGFDLAQVPGTPVSFTLVFGHSATVATALSSVRVDVNDQPVASRPLAQDDPSRVRWQVSLPPDLLRVGTNVLNVHFFLQASGAECQLPPYASVWAAIDAASTLSIPVQPGQGSVDLSMLPFPIVRDGDPSNTTLVVPSKTASQYDALDLAALIGAASTVDAPQITVLPDTAASRAALAGHTVLVDGLRVANRILAGMVPQLPLQALAVDPSLQLNSSAVALDATADERGAVGVVEELSSPWDSRQTAVVISATQPRLLSPARRAAFGGHLSGTAGTVDSQGRLQSFDTGSPAAESSDATLASRPIQALTLLGLGLFGLVLAGVSARKMGRIR